MTHHARQDIRDSLAAILTGLPTTGSRIYPSRVYPLTEDSLPGLLVYTKNEEVDTDTIHHPRTQTRSLTLAVEAYAKLTEGFTDKLDDICKEVEKAVGNNPTLSGVVKDIRLISTEIGLAGSGDKPVGVATIMFRALYRTKENMPEVSI